MIRCAGVLALTLAAATVRPTLLLAHDGVQSSVPATGARLSAVPRMLRLSFGRAPTLALVRIRLIGADGQVVPLAATRLDSVRSVVADIAGAMAEGVHTVQWQSMGADGHPVRGTFTFTIAPGASGLGVSHAGHAAGTGVSDTVAPVPHHDPVTMPSGYGFDAESPGYAVVRWGTFAAVVALVGVVAFRFVVMALMRRRSPARAELLERMSHRRLAGVGAAAAGALAVLAMARIVAQSFAMHGAAGANLTHMGPMLAGTVWGWAWIAQIVAALAALAACLFARRGSRVAWTLVGIAGVMIAFTLSLSGHALSVERWRALTVLADGVHVLGAAAWLGGLFAVLVVGVPGAMALPEADRGAAVVDLVNAFSPAALVFAGVVTVTGVFAAWQHLGALSALWSSGYGRTLIAKLGVLSVVALTGAYNWLRVRPALGGGAGVRRVRRSATIEVVAALVVLAVTAVLVATPPPLMAPASH